MNGNLLFVGGDLSGIQKFIYNITSKRAMVSLKGRSQYLKDYAQSVCDKILNMPELNNTSLSRDEMKIYCSGGKFYLQVPDSPNIRISIDEIRRKEEEDLWNKHQGQLSINIAYEPFCYEEDNVIVGDEKGSIGILWNHISKKFNDLKNQKFKSLLIDQYQEFFEVQKVGGDVKVCQITGVEGAEKHELPFKDKEGNPESLLMLDSVKEQIDLGIDLRKKQNFKMLEEYANKTYLGVLRMDVDNLGSKFVNGFDSMDVYREFSSNLDNFFDAESGKLRDIQNGADFKEHLNIVYAGGDDIFVVGRWDKVIDFAEQVRRQFDTYCKDVLKDDKLSISGGVAIVNSKFPIAKAAELSGNAEDAAKKYNNGQKNAFNMFGESVSWNEEFDYVKNFKEQFVTLIDKCGLSRGVLHKIMKYALMVKENKLIEEENKNSITKRKPNMSFMWHTAYYLTRFMGKEKDNKVVYDFCRDLRDVQLVKIDNYRLISLAARWAELELKVIK